MKTRNNHQDDLRPCVSIIIPCYNNASFIGEAIESALAQTYHSTEVIVIDDGSADGSVDIIKAFGEEIQWETGQNRGACAARNRGIELSQGDYVNFLDADDILAPNKISHQLRLVRRSQPDVIAGAAYLHRRQSYSVKPLQGDKWAGLIMSQLGITSSNLWRRSSLLEVDGWNEDWNSSQEYELLFRLLKNRASIQVDYFPKTLLRRRENSLSQGAKAGIYERRIRLRLRISEFLKQQNLLSNYSKYIKRYIFTELRKLHEVDPGHAATLYHEAFAEDFAPSSVYPVTYRYDWVKDNFGFSTAERLSPFINRFISF